MTITPDRLLCLLRGEYSCLTIGFNDEHSVNYATAQRYHDEWGMYGGGADHQRIQWPSEEERQKALRENSVWTIQWYPETPIGFHCVGASTFEAAAQFALGMAPTGDHHTKEQA
jgi:hypothetical protein